MARKHFAPARRASAWWQKLAFWLILPAALFIALLVALHPLAIHYTRRALDGMDGYKGDFADADFKLFPPTYVLTKLKLIEDRGEAWREPLLYAEAIHVKILWRQLLHRALVARVRIDAAKLSIVNETKSQESEGSAKTRTKKVPDLAEALNNAAPLLIDRVEVRDSEIYFVDLTSKKHPKIWIHALELAAENIATRAALAQGRPTTVAASAKLARSGDLSFFLSADPWAKGLNFAGRADLRGLQTSDLYSLIASKTDLQAPHGTFDCFVEWKAKGGVLTGGIKPVLKNVEIAPDHPDLVNGIKAWVADTALDIVSDRVPGRNAVATVIPIKGSVTDPHAQIMPTVMGILRNAFVAGLAEGFGSLPPPTAGKKEGVVKQVVKTLVGKEKPAAEPEGKKPEPVSARSSGTRRSKERL